MLSTVLLSHSGKVAVEAVFSCYLGRLRPVIHFLKLAKCLVNCRFDVWAGPHHRPFLLAIADFPEPIIFKSVPHQSHVDTVVEFEVQLLVWRLKRPNAHWIDVRPEQHAFLLNFAKNSLRLIFSILVGLVQFAQNSWLIALQSMLNLLLNPSLLLLFAVIAFVFTLFIRVRIRAHFSFCLGLTVGDVGDISVVGGSSQFRIHDITAADGLRTRRSSDQQVMLLSLLLGCLFQFLNFHLFFLAYLLVYGLKIRLCLLLSIFHEWHAIDSPLGRRNSFDQRWEAKVLLLLMNI